MARTGKTETPDVQPTADADPMATATDGVDVGGGKLGKTSDDVVGEYAERPYAEALREDHAEHLRAVGQHPDDQD